MMTLVLDKKKKMQEQVQRQVERKVACHLANEPVEK